MLLFSVVAVFGVAIVTRHVVQRRYGDTPNWEHWVALTNGVLIGFGALVVAVVLFLSGDHGPGVLLTIAGLVSLSISWSATRFLRSPYFDEACEAVAWHKEYERCRYCGGRRRHKGSIDIAKPS